jgi:hypothetical protein
MAFSLNTDDLDFTAQDLQAAAQGLQAKSRFLADVSVSSLESIGRDGGHCRFPPCEPFLLN